MTAVPVRDTPWASWSDPDAWMEAMKGDKWKAVMKEEQDLVKNYTSLPEVKKLIQEADREYDAVEQTKSPIPFYTGLIQVYWHSQFFKMWSFLGSETKHTARDIQVTPLGVFVTTDVGVGAEEFELQLWDNPYATKPVWTLRPVGPELAVLDDTLYYLGVKNKLIYQDVYCCDAATGTGVKRMYHETNPEINLSLERHPNYQLLLLAEQSQQFTIYHILDGKLRQIKEKYSIPHTWILPLIKEFGIQWMWEEQGLLITKQHGQLTLWKCANKASAKKLLSIPCGEILVDPFATWDGSLPCLIRVSEPTGTSYYRFIGTSLELIQAQASSPVSVQRIEARSRHDYMPVHGCLVTPKHKKPTALLCVGYGAYGMPSAVGPVMSRWAPLIQKGWCILFTFPRGGGDHTEAWARAGQRSGRCKTIGDVEGLIKAAQVELGLCADETAVYGRSAGGLLVGNILANHPTGDLVGAVYTEVPYVDVLRTTTNPSLPLTVLEYKEFGNPTASLEDFIWAVLHSPADAATSFSAPNVFVLTRTAVHDSQVFAYESVKWIRRLRSHAPTGLPKLCLLETEQGHFTPPDKTVSQWSIDFALLEGWRTGILPRMRQKM